jgi:4-deoxy-L-threo-5-hexosulose-uronate ketol-isomerase
MAANPADAKSYDTQRLRKDFVIEKLFRCRRNQHGIFYVRPLHCGWCYAREPNLYYWKLSIRSKQSTFFDRRELGIINVGGDGVVKVGDKEYELKFKEALYVGSGDHEVVFLSKDASKPAHFYFNSAPAHKSYPVKKITKKEANVINAGSLEGSNARTINQLIINKIVPCCQLQMGLTELKPGSVWNTMPAHTHLRRMEAYFYFEIPDGQAVCHFMGEPQETRPVWVHNEQAVISPQWSIHCGAGTSNYTFIWGMAGENLDYGDMDVVKQTDLK